jgi:hypothetical protein
MPHSAFSAKCTKMAKALLEAIQKRFGGSSLLLPKEIRLMEHCAMSLAVTRLHHFTGTSALEQRVTVKLKRFCEGEDVYGGVSFC